MISIVNVSPRDTPKKGVNQYEVRLNKRVIAKFEHCRTDGLAQCLRDAADAVECANIKHLADSIRWR